MKWAQVTVTTSQEASDAVANCLFDLDTTGLEIKDEPASTSSSVTLISYFPMDDLVGEHVQHLRQFLASLPLAGIDAQPADVWLRCIAEENWSEQWRSAFPPQKIGKRLIIAPTWHHVSVESPEVVIRLDPGMAFGTGHHPTTRLSIELLEAVIKNNDIVADLGTGSGILAIAAAKLGAKRIDAIDLDGSVIPIAQRNFQLNDVTSLVHPYQGDGLKELDGKYHLIVANILTKAILPMIPQYPEFLKSDGRLVLSGIMASEAQKVEDQLRANGFRVLEIRQQVEQSEIPNYRSGRNWVGISAKIV